MIPVRDTGCVRSLNQFRYNVPAAGTFSTRNSAPLWSWGVIQEVDVEVTDGVWNEAKVQILTYATTHQRLLWVVPAT